MSQPEYRRVTLDQPESQRQRTIKLIEDVILQLVTDVAHNVPPQLTIRNTSRWENITFDDRNNLKKRGEAFETTVNFSAHKSRNKMMIIIHVLSKIHRLLTTKSTCTKRELYYQNVALFKTQSVVDGAINFISNLLDMPPWELGVTSSSKGLAAGPMSLHMSNREIIKYDVGGEIANLVTVVDGAINFISNLLDMPPWELGVTSSSKGLAAGPMSLHMSNREIIKYDVGGGVMLPQNIGDIREIGFGGKYVLIVEKDAAFQKLLDENIFQRQPDCVLITITWSLIAKEKRYRHLRMGFPPSNTEVETGKTLWKQSPKSS
ncbi:meiotic recombination protein SPO11-like [Diaphorina citri]|uniref:DNA topoisomerase (ATP-hydrolyzing) n=1 Tax=Diaphorina citri TaxID=121845 RepID=A0A3Q0ITU3_DIACI|nr:meiotic recombination protein SPO11-like [Diaphorina citri]